MKDTVLSQLAALKGASAPVLKARWRELFESEPPAYNRRFLESRLAYRIQELAYGGLSRETVARLRVMAKQYATRDAAERKARPVLRPIAGTKLIREYQGVEYCVTVRVDDFEYLGRPYSSLSSIAREITGTKWNGLVFFGLKRHPGPNMTSPRAKHHRHGADRSRTEDRNSGGSDLHGVTRKLRCAVYTRKSSEEGLDMEFNSLDAQREACDAYIASQRGEGWIQVADRYDDGGVSGGTLDRPALKRLLADVQAGKIDIVVVYKVDRLSRSLLDFHKLIELFERHQTTFVSITQSFNTTDAMGRMHLNIMLTFAQYEREVIGERIRDKVAASRKKGMWMGGWTPLGYEVRDRKLIIHEAAAERVRSIFKKFVQLKSATLLARELVAAGATNRYGHLLDKGVLYKLLNNRVYIGEAVHKGVSYPGEHEAYRPQALGPGTCHSQAELTQAGSQHAGADSGIAEGPPVWT